MAFQFSIGSVGAIYFPNLKSALENPASVNDKFSKELTAGRIVALFNFSAFDMLKTSPLGIVS